MFERHNVKKCEEKSEEMKFQNSKGNFLNRSNYLIRMLITNSYLPCLCLQHLIARIVDKNSRIYNRHMKRNGKEILSTLDKITENTRNKKITSNKRGVL